MGSISMFQVKEGGSIDDLLQYTNNFIEAMNSVRENLSRFIRPSIPNYPQYLVEVDAALCKRNDISPADVLSTLAGYVGEVIPAT